MVAGLMFFAFWKLVTINEDKLLRTPYNIVFLGNSTVEYGIDDKIVTNSLNFGLNGDHIEYMYAKLKLLKKYNPQIDTVVINLDNIIINKDIRTAHASELMHPFFFDCYSLDEIIAAARYSSFDWFTSYLAKPFSVLKITIPVTSIFRNYRIQDVGIGCYASLERNKLAEDIERYNAKTAKGHKPKSPSMATEEVAKVEYVDNKFTLYFYNRIIDFCRTEGITPIFIAMPQYPLEPSYAYREFHNRHFNDIPLLDYQDIVLADSLWADAAHLNTRGAQIFSRILQSKIHPESAFQTGFPHNHTTDSMTR